MSKNIKTAVEEIAMPIAQQMGYEYVDTEYAKQGKDWLLTVTIDKPEGVTLEDCEAVSRAVEAVLDEQDFIADAYCLCVSSVGLDRPLKTPRDFERCAGKRIDVKLYKPFDGKKEFNGVLTAHDEQTFTIETDENEMIFEYKEAAKVCLHLDF